VDEQFIQFQVSTECKRGDTQKTSTLQKNAPLTLLRADRSAFGNALFHLISQSTTQGLAMEAEC